MVIHGSGCCSESPAAVDLQRARLQLGQLIERQRLSFHHVHLRLTTGRIQLLLNELRDKENCLPV